MGQLAFSEMFDSAEEATAAAISSSDKEFKDVAAALYPSLKPQTAYAKLKDALGRKGERDGTLSADEHVWIANYVQRFQCLHYIASRCHHSMPQPVAPKDELADLYRKHIELSEQLVRLAPRLEKAEARLRSVGGTGAA